MNFILKFCICFISGLFLVSCATQVTLNDEVATVSEAKRSYIIGRYAVECTPRKEKCNQSFNSLIAKYKNIGGVYRGGNLDSTTGSIFGGNSTYDFTSLSNSETGYYFCKPIPSGQYAFYTYEFWNFAGGGSGYSLRDEDQFELAFSADPGEIVYLGRIKLTTSKGKNIFGMKLNTPGLMLLAPGSESDIQAALKKCPLAVQSKAVRKAPLDASTINKPGLVYNESEN